jgi:polyisoprenoid-binding protein YceI
MKLWTAAIAAAALAACTQPAEKAPAGPIEPVAIEAPSGEYALDPHHSTLTARALRFGLANYTLRFNRLSGALNFNADSPAESAVEVTVDTTSLDTPYGGDRDFDAELQNSEWLDAGNHPTATFRSTAIELTGPNTGRVTGDLTIRGVTRPATLDVTFNNGFRQHPSGQPISVVGFSARGTIQRSQYGVMAMLPRSGEASGVADDVELVIEAVFNRPLDQAPVVNTPAEPVN